MDTIGAIADRHGLIVVEDACQAHGATFRGRRAGSFGHGAFSLYGTKNMTTGEGGFITTTTTGWPTSSGCTATRACASATSHEILGYNFRLTDIAAAIGLVQLGKLERNTARRQAIAARYDEAFADLPVRDPVTPDGRMHVFHQYTIDVGPAPRRDRARPARGRRRRRDLLPDPRPPPAVRDGARPPRRPAGHRRAAARTLSLPMYPGPDRGGTGEVVEAVRSRRRAPHPARRATARRRPRRSPAAGAVAMTDGPGSPTGRVARSGVGLAGLGSMGRNHLRVLARPARCRLVAVADPVAAALDAAVAASGAQGFASRWRWSRRPTSTRS